MSKSRDPSINTPPTQNVATASSSSLNLIGGSPSYVKHLAEFFIERKGYRRVKDRKALSKTIRNLSLPETNPLRRSTLNLSLCHFLKKIQAQQANATTQEANELYVSDSDEETIQKKNEKSGR